MNDIDSAGMPFHLPSSPPALEILGVRVHHVTREQSLAYLKRFATDGRSHHIVTVNPEFVMAAGRNRAFMQVLNQADLALPDGIGIVWASRVLGQPLPDRVTGVDTLRDLAAFAATHGLRPFLLGAAPGIADAAAQQLCQQYPGLRIAGTYAGSPAPEDEDYQVEMILSARPDFLFVAYGAPQQDQWIARTRPRLQVPIAMGVGGTFDFIAGRVYRAPLWMQRRGLEWFHRLTQEPWRWRRMRALPLFAFRVLLARMRSDNPGSSPPE